MALGTHALLDAADCRVDVDCQLLVRVLLEVPPALGLTMAARPSVVQQGPVAAGIVLLSESHLSLHFDVERRQLHADLFSCSDFDVDAFESLLRGAFEFDEARTERLVRGGGL